MKALEGVQPSTSMRSGVGVGGSLAGTQQPRSPVAPNSPSAKGFSKSGKGATTRPMGATLPVSTFVQHHFVTVV